LEVKFGTQAACAAEQQERNRRSGTAGSGPESKAQARDSWSKIVGIEEH
jgi:hypothetical protein